MRHWVDAACTLRDIQLAQEEFGLRWMIDQSITGPMLLDRLAADLGGSGPNFSGANLQAPCSWDDEST